MHLKTLDHVGAHLDKRPPLHNHRYSQLVHQNGNFFNLHHHHTEVVVRDSDVLAVAGRLPS